MNGERPEQEQRNQAVTNSEVDTSPALVSGMEKVSGGCGVRGSWVSPRLVRLGVELTENSGPPGKEDIANFDFAGT